MPLYIRNREEFESQVITIHSDGSSIRQIARHFGVGRNTVRRILRCNRKQRDTGHSVLPPKIHRKSKLTPFIPTMKALIEKFPNITGIRLIEELRLAGYEGGGTIVTDRLRSLRPKPKKEPTMRFETAPGYQGQMDWSPYTIPFVRSGKATVLCFSLILGFSRRQYMDFTTDRNHRYPRSHGSSRRYHQHQRAKLPHSRIQKNQPNSCKPTTPSNEHYLRSQKIRQTCKIKSTASAILTSYMF